MPASSNIIKLTVAESVLRPLGDNGNKDNPNFRENGPDRRKKIVDFSKVTKTTVKVKVTDQQNNPVPNYTFTLNALVRPNSGGHDHDTGRPIGRFITHHGDTLTIFQDVTDENGEAQYTYLSSGIGGVDSLFVQGATATDTASATIQLKIAELALLRSGTHYTLVGQTASHTINHYGRHRTLTILNQLADSSFADSSWVLQYNDMSLLYGGPFDYSSNHFWDTPHETHREGKSTDMRPRSRDERAINLRWLRDLFGRNDWGEIREEGRRTPNHHYHLIIR